MHLKNTNKLPRDRIAFLITAHCDFAQLSKLCHALDYPKFDIYIHINKLVKIDINKINIKLKYSRIFVLKNRTKVHWGGYSLFNAILKMYKMASKKNIYLRYVNISGLDYPIKGNDEIYRRLSDNKIEFIISSPLFKKDYYKVVNKCFFDLDLAEEQNRITYRIRFLKQKLLGRTNRPDNVPINEYSHLYIDRRDYPVYFSCTWLGLTDDFIKYFLYVYKRKRKIKKYFKYAWCPDELIIPTILFNSPFKEKALGLITDETLHYNYYPSLHYLNYDSIIEIYDENSFDKIINSNKLFVRKVTTEKSIKLVEMIDKYRNK